MQTNNKLTPIYNGSVLVNEAALHDQAIMNVLQSHSETNFEFKPIHGDHYTFDDLISQ